ncbi:hypothetical protein KDA08_04020, partial [Candidatus Saccharibacteria bacterium]|nr:hypothetical protein [Candidatus Saccharibacteria bacterium]
DITFANLRSLLESELTESGYNWDLMSLGIFQKEGKSTKNISFRITLGSNERTLVTDEVTKLIDSLSWRAHEELGAEKI